jgi:hypothetical protein
MYAGYCQFSPALIKIAGSPAIEVNESNALDSRRSGSFAFFKN